jgi:hypothetical protein
VIRTLLGDTNFYDHGPIKDGAVEIPARSGFPSQREFRQLVLKGIKSAMG